jgi:hypothetical protein
MKRGEEIGLKTVPWLTSKLPEEDCKDPSRLIKVLCRLETAARASSLPAIAAVTPQTQIAKKIKENILLDGILSLISLILALFRIGFSRKFLQGIARIMYIFRNPGYYLDNIHFMVINTLCQATSPQAKAL